MGHPSTALAEQASGKEALRILLVVRPDTLLRFAHLVPHLAERGHHLHISFGRRPDRRVRQFVDSVAARFSGVTSDIAPQRPLSDGWRSVAWLVRGTGDLARYSHPRYDAAPVLRDRAKQTVTKLLETEPFEPLGRRLALRTVRRLTTTTDAQLSERLVRLAAALEDAIPSSPLIERYLEERAPDVVLAASITRTASEEVEFLKSARRLGIPTGICVASWDKLTNKGLLKFVPERVFVWNEVQAREAAEYHAIPVERLRMTGAQSFDEWFERRPTSSREELTSRFGLDPSLPYVLYLCSSPMTTGSGEIDFVIRWLEALRGSADERLRRFGVAVRPHPSTASDWQDVGLTRFENAVVCPSAHHYREDARAEFFDTLAHSAAVVGINTTAMIEAAIVGKSVLTVLNRDFAQETTLHFHYLLQENGGFLHVAGSVEEHLGQLARVLDEDEAGAEQRRRFVESFVRPAGLDRPAVPILADAIEELAGAAVDGRARPSSLLLRPVLALEAGLASVYASRLRRQHPAGHRDAIPELRAGGAARSVRSAD